VLHDLTPTLVSLHRLSPSLNSLFVNLGPLITAGRTGLPAASHVVRGLDPTLAQTGPFLQQLNPILQFLELNQGKVSDFISLSSAALAGKRSVVPGSPSTGHVLPQIIVAGTQSVPALIRTPDNRGSAYPPPDDHPDSVHMVLPGFDCANSGGEQKPSLLLPGCKVQDSVPFQGLTLRYPHVREGGPGGTAPPAP
jgi:hypothetical protein